MKDIQRHGHKQSMKPEQVRDISYTLRRHYVDQFHSDAFNQDMTCNDLILDIGGNKKSKRGLFDIDCYENTVIYANLSDAKSPDVVNDASCLPFRSETFDSVICSELLEHVYDPRKVIVEVRRTLKPGGKVMICVPFMVGIHGDPYDFGRYTDSFWSRLLDETGFTSIEIQAQGAYYSVFYDMLRSMIYKRIANWGPERRISISVIGRILGMLKTKALDLDTRSMADGGTKNPNITTGYGIIAVKK